MEINWLQADLPPRWGAPSAMSCTVYLAFHCRGTNHPRPGHIWVEDIEQHVENTVLEDIVKFSRIKRSVSWYVLKTLQFSIFL